MLVRISAFLLRILGWKIVGKWPALPKFVLIVMPHTSNWDFVLGILVRKALGQHVQFIAKNSLFKPPFGSLFRWMGGIPVDRSVSTNFVDAVVQAYHEREALALVIAPEGTRQKVNKLKTGFYFIAKGAKVPIVLFAFDFGNKQVVIHPAFYPSNDQAADFDYFRQQAAAVKGKIPEYGWGYEP